MLKFDTTGSTPEEQDIQELKEGENQSVTYLGTRIIIVIDHDVRYNNVKVGG